MKIKIWEIDKSKNKLGFDYSEDLNYLTKELNQLVEITPVSVKGEAFKMAGIYTVKGNIFSTMKFQCSRCLNLYDYEVEASFEELFVPDHLEMDIDNDDENVHPLKSDEIEITKIIEETVLLNIPYVPICDPDCKGLCTSCGINLNLESCNCQVEKVDPRLAELAKWFDQKNRTE